MAKTTTKDTLTRAFEEDVTKAPQATTQQDVEGQDARTRLWQSLDTTYGNQREQVGKQYDQAISQTDRQLLNRGMQRSSYAAQTLANMQQDKIKANSDIMSNQIADYQNRLSALEQQEQQFAYQKERDQIADQQWQQSFDAQQAQWKEQFEYNKMSANQQIAYNYLMNMLESGDNPSDALLKQAGITRKDYEQMKATPVVKARSDGRGNPGPLPTDDNPNPNPSTNDDMFDDELNDNQKKQKTKRKSPIGMVGINSLGRNYDMTK